MTKDDLKVGHIYRARHPRRVANALLKPALFNDRAILWMAPDRSYVQFDSPALPRGRRYPQVPLDQFLAWADRDVTEDYARQAISDDNWMEWRE